MENKPEGSFLLRDSAQDDYIFRYNNWCISILFVYYWICSPILLPAVRRTQPITKGQNFFSNPCPIGPIDICMFVFRSLFYEQKFVLVIIWPGILKWEEGTYSLFWIHLKTPPVSIQFRIMIEKTRNVKMIFLFWLSRDTYSA